MSVTLQTPFKSFTAAPGATLFSTDFRVILATDLVVRKDGVVQTSGFTVSGLGNPSGVDVTFGVPMVGGEIIELQRSVPLVRATDYQQTGDFLSPVVNTDFDRLWMALQDSQFLSNLAILLPVGDALAPMTIPSVADRASKFFAFNALGQAIAAVGASSVPVSAFMATLLDDLNAAAGRATLGAAASGAIGASGLTMATQRFLGRLTAGSGAPEELTPAQVAAVLPLRNYRDGLKLSPAGGSATMPIGAGHAADSTNTVLMNLAATINKTTSAWAVGSGNGGIDTGAVANNTWYHWFLIRRPDTGVVDALFSLSATAPTLPANYTQFRRIGSGRTNGSAQWQKIRQEGHDFIWATPPAADFNTTGSITAASLTVNTPTGVKTKALLVAGGPNANGIYISSLDDDDVAPSASATPFVSAFGVNAGNGGGSQVQVWTNTAAQVRHRALNTNAYLVATIGWYDPLGEDA